LTFTPFVNIFIGSNNIIQFSINAIIYVFKTKIDVYIVEFNISKPTTDYNVQLTHTHVLKTRIINLK